MNTDSPLRISWPALILFTTFIGLLNFGVIITNRLANQENLYFLWVVKELTNELIGAYAALPLIPFILRFFEKFPLKVNNLLKRLPLFIGVSIAYGVCHTLLLYFSRVIIYYLAGWGSYDQYYGLLRYRFLMEYQKQFLVFWLIYGAWFFFRTWQAHQAQKLQTAELSAQLAKAQLQSLQMQLNPHFLFNTLNMISATMYENVTAADKMIANLSDLLRSTLKEKNVGQHSLAAEIALLDRYLQIMEARFKDRLVIHKKVAKETESALVPALILQPLVENAIKFGMEKLEKVTVIISTKKSEDRLVLAIRDNGPGFKTSFNGKMQQNGVGISNSAKRLETLYGDQHRFLLQNNKQGGAEVLIDIPFQF